MRNPIRLKNLQLRFLPYYVAGVLVLLTLRPTGPLFALGVAFVLAGALLRGWGAGHLVKNDSLAITGPYAHLRHPLYAGSLLVGALKFQLLVRLSLDGERVTGEERFLERTVGRIRDVRVGPDGFVYLLTDASNGRLLRLEPAD